MEITNAFFDILFVSGDLFHYVLLALVPFCIILFALGVIWGLTKNVFNRF